MRRFRFVGDPSEYCNDFQNGGIYDYSVLPDTASSIHMNVEWLASEYPNDWQEVFDSEQPPKPPHKDTDLGYYMLELLKIRMGSRPRPFINFDEDVNDSIQKAKELINQLNEEMK